MHTKASPDRPGRLTPIRGILIGKDTGVVILVTRNSRREIYPFL